MGDIKSFKDKVNSLYKMLGDVVNECSSLEKSVEDLVQTQKGLEISNEKASKNLAETNQTISKSWMEFETKKSVGFTEANKLKADAESLMAQAIAMRDEAEKKLAEARRQEQIHTDITLQVQKLKEELVVKHERAKQAVASLSSLNG